jgi:hypothetical protein
MKAVRFLGTAALVLALLPLFVARGYLVGPPPGLEEMAGKADVIFQGTVVSNTTVNAPDLQPVPGFIEQETEFRPAWAIKGKAGDGEIKFRHYAPDPQPAGFMFAPQSYSFTVGKSYLVFAKQPSDYAAGTFQQLWTYPVTMPDVGVLLCYRPEPFGSFGRDPMKEFYWRDLTELLKSADPKDVVYATEHLDEYGAGTNRKFGRFGTLSEFERLEVLKAVHGLMASADPTVAQAALGVVGSYNPYMTRDAQHWLATVGSADTPGYDKSDAKFVNDGGMIYWREIAAVVDSKADDVTGGDGGAGAGAGERTVAPGERRALAERFESGGGPGGGVIAGGLSGAGDARPDDGSRDGGGCGDARGGGLCDRVWAIYR